MKPTDNDVLSGRGASFNQHPGNEHFRKMIEDNKVRQSKNFPLSMLNYIDAFNSMTFQIMASQLKTMLSNVHNIMLSFQGCIHEGHQEAKDESV